MLFLRSQFVWICCDRGRLALVRVARALPASSPTWCWRNINNSGREFMCTCEHIEVVRQVTCVLKYRKVPELELIPPQLDGQQLGRSCTWERDPGAALFTNTWSISWVTGLKPALELELHLFPSLSSFLRWSLWFGCGRRLRYFKFSRAGGQIHTYINQMDGGEDVELKQNSALASRTGASLSHSKFLSPLNPEPDCWSDPRPFRPPAGTGGWKPSSVRM